MRILVAASQDGTNATLTRALGVAESARARGHDVTVTLPENLVGRARAVLRDSVLPIPDPPGLATMLETSVPIRSVGDFAAVMGWLDEDYFSDNLRRAERLLAGWRPDVVVSDFRLDMGVACATAGVPLLAMATWALDAANPENTSEPPGLRAGLAIAEARLGHDLRSAAELVVTGATAVVVPAIAELSPLLSFRGEQRFMGHVYSSSLEDDATVDAGWGDARLRVVAYVSASDLDYEALVLALDDACADARASCVLLLGGMEYVPEGRSRRGHVRILDFAPAGSLLRSADVHISHGGINSLLNSLRHGVPVIGLPAASSERRDNLERAARFGCARILETSDLDGASLVRAIAEMTGARARESAADLGRRVRASRGATGVVEVAEREAGRSGNHAYRR